MFVQTVILCLCISTPYLLQAQSGNSDKAQEDYIKFTGTLDKELIELGKDTNQLKTNVLHPALLPEWFFNLPDSKVNCIYTIGISDPGMEEEDAFELAVLRAKCITFLLLFANISNVIDNYTNDKQTDKTEEFTTKYVNYFRIKALGLVDERKFEVINQDFTSFNEAIVLLKYTIDDGIAENVDSLKVIFDVYQAERQKYNKFEMEEKYEAKGTLSSNISNEVFNYTFHSLNNLFEITSSYNDKKLHFPYFYFRYQGQSQDQHLSINNSISSKLNYGLWKAYMEIFLQKILLLSQPNAVKIEKVGDDYTSKNQDFTREVFESEPAVKLVNIFISNNQLFIEMDYLK